MDYTNIPRAIIYKDDDDLDWFPIDIEGSMQNVFYTKLVERPFIMESEEAAEIILKIFNNAYYLSMLINLEKRPRLYLNKYYEIAQGTRQDAYPYLKKTTNIVTMNHMMPATMALVCNLLSLHGGNKFIDIIKLICNNFNVWDLKGSKEGKADFFILLLTGDKYKEFLADGVDYFFETRPLHNILLDEEISPQDIAKGIEYITDKMIAEYKSDDEDVELFYNWLKRKIDKLEGNDNVFIPAQKELSILARCMRIDNSSIEPQESQTSSTLEDIIKELEEERAKNKQFEKLNEQLNEESARLKEHVKELEEENKLLKNTSPTQKEDDEVKRLTQEKEEMTIELLMPIFYNKEQDVREFLEKIDGRPDTEITDTVHDFMKARKISEKSKGRALWSVLHAAKYYSSTESNWNTALRNHPK